MAVKPEDYRWSSMGYHAQTYNNVEFLSTDFGLSSYGEMSEAERLTDYREFLNEKGSIETEKGGALMRLLLRRKGVKSIN